MKHSIELRDLSADKIARLGEQIQKRAQQIAQQTGTEIIIKKVENDPPAMASRRFNRRSSERPPASA